MYKQSSAFEQAILDIKRDSDQLAAYSTALVDSGWCRASAVAPEGQNTLSNRPNGVFDSFPPFSGPLAHVGLSVYTVLSGQIIPPGTTHNRIGFQHNMGITPTKISLLAGLILPDHTDISAASVSHSPQLYYDGAQGQYVGYTVIKNDPNVLTLAVAPWVAYNEFINQQPNSTGWYAMDYLNLYVRVILFP